MSEKCCLISRYLLFPFRPDVICCSADGLFLHRWCGLVGRAASTSLQLLSRLSSSLLHDTTTTLALLIHSRKTISLTSDDASLYFRRAPTVNGQFRQKSRVGCCCAGVCICIWLHVCFVRGFCPTSFPAAKKWDPDKGLSVWVQLLSPRLLS